MKAGIIVTVICVSIFALAGYAFSVYQNDRQQLKKEALQQLVYGQDGKEVLDYSLNESKISNKENVYDSSALEKIDKNIEKCIEKTEMTNADMIQCSIEAEKEYLKAIDIALKKSKTIMSASEYNQLQITQKKWLEFTDANNNFIASTVETPDNGTMAFLSGQNLRYQNTKFRAEVLSSFYFLYKDIVLPNK